MGGSMIKHFAESEQVSLLMVEYTIPLVSQTINFRGSWRKWRKGIMGAKVKKRGKGSKRG